MFIVIVILLLSCLFYVYSLSKEWVIKQHFLNMGFQILIFMSLFLCSNTPKARKHRCNSRASAPALDELRRGVQCAIPLTMHPCSVVFFPPFLDSCRFKTGLHHVAGLHSSASCGHVREEKKKEEEEEIRTALWIESCG